MADPLDPTKLAADADEATKKVSSLEEALDAFNRKAIESSEDSKSLGNALGAAGEGAKALALTIGGGLKTSLNAIKEVGEVAFASVSKSARGLYDPLKESTTIANLFGDVGGKAIRGFDEAIKNLVTAQMTMRSAIAVSGQSIKESAEAIKNYPQALREMSAYTGFTKGEIDKFNQTVGRMMPESLRMASKESVGLKDNVGGMVQPTVVAMTAFKAFGIEGAAAANKTLEAFLSFSQSPIDTARNLGVMAAAAKGTGIDLQTAQEQISKSSSSLAIFGRQTGESAAVWRTFAETLRAGGVPIAEVGNIVESVTKSIAGMSMENRAFIGMMSGLTKGASALGGALKLELAMRQEGGMQKNLEALSGTLAKFGGGKIITLEQAENNPQLEQQFVLQRQMLGKLGMQGTAEQQNRMLEVLQKVQSGGMSAIDADKATKEIFDKGKDLQQASLTALESIDRTLQATFGGGIDTKLDDMNQGLKGSGPGGKSNLEAWQTAAIQMTSPDTRAINQRGIRSAMGRTAGDVINTTQRAVRIRTGRQGVRRGPVGVEPLATGALEDLGAQIFRYTTRGGRPTMPEASKAVELPESSLLKASAPAATAIPSRPILRSRSPEAAIPAIANLSGTVSRGDAQTHRDLQQLLEATRSGLAPLREIKPPTTPTNKVATDPTAASSGSTSTLFIKFEGGDENAINKIKKAIKEEFNKNTLGIYGD
ncbi:MAG: hypothetical protein WC516_08205 [Patescibacteria group bacterium]|jgi:hypothetical protein